MNRPDAPVVTDLDSSWPPFLDLLDSNPGRARELFHRFAWALFKARPPSILHSLQPADREDRISDLVMSCSRDSFRKLRQYKNTGSTFAAWLSVVLDRDVRAWMRSRKPVEEVTEVSARTKSDTGLGLLGRISGSVQSGLRQIGTKCRVYLGYRADGLKPKEIVEELGMSASGNKRVSDDLRYCMVRLRDFLVARGVRPSEVVPREDRKEKPE